MLMIPPSESSPPEPEPSPRSGQASPARDAWRRNVLEAGRLATAFRGCLLGGALGDSLGWPVEFLSLAHIQARYGQEGIQELDARAEGGLGAITDDTQMTLFTAEGVLRGTVRGMERMTVEQPERGLWPGMHEMMTPMLGAYHRWLCTQGEVPPEISDRWDEREAGWLIGVRQLHARRAPGNTCLGALRSTLRTYWDALDAGTARNDSKGCGGVMRVAPIGLVPSADPFSFAANAARLTHGHPTGYLAAGAYAQIIHALLHERSPLAVAVGDTLDRLAREPNGEETARALWDACELSFQPIEPSAERVESLGRGWIAEEALAIGVYCALVARDFVHGVRLAVNHSGDSDSTGSIAGALLGAQVGEYGLPAEWLRALELREVITQVADDLLLGYEGGAAWRKRYPGC